MSANWKLLSKYAQILANLVTSLDFSYICVSLTELRRFIKTLQQNLSLGIPL